MAEWLGFNLNDDVRVGYQLAVQRLKSIAVRHAQCQMMKSDVPSPIVRVQSRSRLSRPCGSKDAPESKVGLQRLVRRPFD